MTEQKQLSRTKEISEDEKVGIYDHYPEYKKSDILWLEKIPLSWEETKLKFCVDRFISGQTPSTGNEEYWADDNEGIPWVTISDLTKEFYVKSTEKFITEKGRKSKDLKILPKDTVLYAIYASLGKVGILNTSAVISQAILGLFLNEEILERKFLTYWLTNLENYIGLYSSDNTQKNLSAQKVKNFKIAFPKKGEQKSIVKFLDRETSKIDQLIEKKEKLIELLEEKRTALISKTITQGLDENVEMKDSGIEWLGKIPKHWDTQRLKFCAKINPFKSELDGIEPDTKVTFLPMENVSENGKIDYEETKTLSDVIEGYTYFRENDILVAKITPCFENGKGALARDLENGIGFGSTEFVVVRPYEILDEKFFYYVTASRLFRKIGEGEMKGAAGQKRVSDKFFQNFPQFLPPKEEQKYIVEYLDRETEKINHLIEKIEIAIEKLKEYRKALISNAVTGKIDVRGEV